MSKFTSTKAINSRWRNNDFVGVAGSTHTFPDQFHDEFLVDWALQISDGSIVITETPTTGNIQMAALTVSGTINLGDATDTNLYRSAANTLATDDNFYVGQSLTVVGDIINPGQLDFSASGAVAASVTNAGLYLPAGRYITFEGATDNAFETVFTVENPTADRTVTIQNATGTVALTADKLSAFAGTTSAELAGVISDETGSGALVFANSPVLNHVEITNTGGTPRIHGVYLPDGHNITFEGTTTDEFETTLTVADPTADRTITLPNDTGTVALTSHTHTDISAAGWEAYTFGTAGVIATVPRFMLTSSASPSSGSIVHSRIIPHRDFVVNNLAFVSTSATSVPTLVRFGIYTRSGTTFTLVARTASDTTIFDTTQTKYTRALDTTGGYPATYTLTAGTEYFLSVIQVATTPATILLGTARQASAANAATGAQYYTDASETDLVASSTGTVSTTLGGLFAEVS